MTVRPTILVTGASGLIGRALVRRLLASAVPVRVQVRDRARFLASMQGQPELRLVELKECDFNQASSAETARLADGCESVVHTQALVHQPGAPWEAYELLNVRTTEQLARSAAAAGVETFVFLSSTAVYGDGPFDRVQETAQAKPVTPYAVSKLTSEQWLKTFPGFKRSIVLRLAMVFGEGDRGNLIKLIRQVKRGLYFQIGKGEAEKSLIYSRDAAAAVELCLSDKIGAGHHLFNVANPEPVSVRELARQIAKCLGRASPAPALPAPLVVAAAAAAEMVLGKRAPLTREQIAKLMTTTTCSVERFLAATGFMPEFALFDALAAEITWAKAAGLL